MATPSSPVISTSQRPHELTRARTNSGCCSSIRTPATFTATGPARLPSPSRPLRYTAAHYPNDRLLAELIGDLSINSPEFAKLWSRHDVQLCSSDTKLLHHPEIGDLDLHYEVLHLPDSNGQRILTHTATPGSPSADALQLL